MNRAANRRARKTPSAKRNRIARLRLPRPAMAVPAGFFKPYLVPSPKFGVDPRARMVRGLVLHYPTGYTVDVIAGHVYGRSGEQIGVGYKPGDYVRVTGAVGTPLTLYAHRLVWECVNGPIPEGHHIDHKNSIKDDNRSRNLQAVTPSRNCELAFERGDNHRGERASFSKLTEDQVRRIRRQRNVSITEFARLFGVGLSTISAVRNWKSWRHVKSRVRRPSPRKTQD